MPCRARAMTGTCQPRSKQNIFCRARAWHGTCWAWLCELATFTVVCKVSGRNSNDDQFTITKLIQSFTTDDTIGTACEGILSEHSRQCQGRAWHVPSTCLAVWCESSLNLKLTYPIQKYFFGWSYVKFVPLRFGVLRDSGLGCCPGLSVTSFHNLNSPFCAGVLCNITVSYNEQYVL